MYSKALLEHFHHPRNVGALADPDVTGTAGEPGHGNYLVLHLRLNDDRIIECGFQTFGCAAAIASGSVITELIKGRSIQEALQLAPQDVEDALGGLPLGKRHCASLAIQALHAALESIHQS